jgi:hypothetical protein
VSLGVRAQRRRCTSVIVCPHVHLSARSNNLARVVLIKARVSQIVCNLIKLVNRIVAVRSDRCRGLNASVGRLATATIVALILA